MMNLDSTQALLKEDISSYQEQVSRIHKMIHDKSGAGNDRLGWVDWAENYDKEEFERKQLEMAQQMQQQPQQPQAE